MPQLFDLKPVLIRAFTAAKTKMPTKSKYSDDYITRGEFRWLLKYLRVYYEYWVAFEKIDLDSDRRIGHNEFFQASNLMERWGIDMSNPAGAWAECDRDGKGKVLFEEFSDWAIKKNLDLDTDDNDDPDLTE